MRAWLLSLALFLVGIPAACATDFTQQLKQLDGTDFTDDGKPVQITLAKVATTALLASYPDEQNLDGQEKIKRFVLAEKIYKGGTSVDLDADQISLVKKLIAKSYNPLITGEAWRILDPKSVP